MQICFMNESINDDSMEECCDDDLNEEEEDDEFLSSEKSETKSDAASSSNLKLNQHSVMNNTLTFNKFTFNLNEINSYEDILLKLEVSFYLLRNF